MVAHLGAALREGRFEEGLTQALEEVSAVLISRHAVRSDGLDLRQIK